jgi:DHA2 family multidrug resistance protein
MAMPVTGYLSDRLPRHAMATTGLMLLAASFALMASVGPDTAYAVMLLWVIVGRIGLALVLPSLGLASVHGLEGDMLSQASSTISFVRQLGGAIGVSLAGIALEWRLAARGATLGDDPHEVLARSRAFDDTFIGVAAVIACAALFALRMRPPRQEEAQ